MAEAPLVLITGISGYIASHIAYQLLSNGKVRVRGTVRSLKSEDKVQSLRDIVPNPRYPLELVEADLEDGESWKEAVKGCSYVYHVASPVPLELPRDENEVIRPAVQGTLNVLRACAESNVSVKRVVLTSSLGAVMNLGNDDTSYVFSEKDWLDLENATSYSKSKCLAEKAAWDFVDGLDVSANKFELAVCNPSVVIGPLVSSTGRNSSSLTAVKNILNGSWYPFILDLSLPVIDVRDVAAAHIAAMETPKAAGNRYIVNAQSLWLKDIADVLLAEFGPQGYRIGTWVMPKAGAWVISFFSGVVSRYYSSLGKRSKYNCEKMKTELGIEPRDVRQSIIETGYSLIEYGVIDKTPGYTGPSIQ